MMTTYKLWADVMPEPECTIIVDLDFDDVIGMLGTCFFDAEEATFDNVDDHTVFIEYDSQTWALCDRPDKPDFIR